MNKDTAGDRHFDTATGCHTCQLIVSFRFYLIAVCSAAPTTTPQTEIKSESFVQ
jgi:hypothetical protein